MKWSNREGGTAFSLSDSKFSLFIMEIKLMFVRNDNSRTELPCHTCVSISLLETIEIQEVRDEIHHQRVSENKKLFLNRDGE
jgi:hypothetical protein